MRRTSAAKLEKINHRLTTSSVEELVKWHQELRKSLDPNAKGEEEDESRALLMKIQKALVSANSSSVKSNNESYKELIRIIQDQENRL